MAMARRFGGIAFTLVVRQREKTLTHLRLAFANEKSEEEIRGIAREVFENLAMTMAELLQFPKLSREKVEKLVDAGGAYEIYNRLLAEGNGLISVTAHIGNWELLAGIFGLRGHSGAVLARRIYYEPYNRWIVGLRQSLKVPTIYRDDSSRDILKRLARNEIIGLLPDQDIDSLKGVFVPFFGRLAYTPVAPVRLAMTSGAPILPNFLVRQKDGRYKLVAGQVLRVPDTMGLGREEASRKMTEDWMRQFENVIRMYPGQWAWMHNRWRTQPSAKEGKETVAK